MEEDFIPLSGGNDFNALYRASRDDDIVLEDGELSSDSETDSDDIDEDDMHDADDIAINVQAGLPLISFSRPGKAQVMFTVAEAVVKFETMRRAGYPLNLPTTRTRYGLFQEDTTPHSGTNISSAPSPASRRLSVSSATSEEAAAAPTARVPPPTIAAPRARAVPEAPAPAAQPETYNPGRDYVFNWGINSGKRFADILANPSDPYLKTIGGQLYIFVDKHPGLKEAFEYYKSHFMPGQIRFTRPVQAQSQSSYNQVQQQAPQTQTRPSQAGPSRSQPPPSAPRGPRNPSSNGHSSGSSSGPPRGAPSGPSSGPSRGAPNGTSSRSSISNTWRFPKGMHKGKTLHDVDEHYIKTMGGNPKIRQSWSGFAEALQDYREKTQTQSRA
ncbi:predicted protein [Pyrenophora tritici-repentis Pt-1C-BFP]|uniref:Uncharacterized protein n=1 Tax=Pyrenophora tritici-repentis (strain Pt-1C-BFP) TaxID=426418 RepID=B2W6S1_PYRTR|nr:uncharacterized protein PTRG_05509 [Pyrenophora tritici-repentis Pt-1C-BFP]EDU48429.1 predicted protein [Pyrenophora tritici-repentis Pt-1C-BFP]